MHFRNKHVDSVSKVNFVIIKHLIEYVNGTMIVHPADSWGYKNKSTNEYTGMIGSLKRNVSEIGGIVNYINIYHRIFKVS